MTEGQNKTGHSLVLIADSGSEVPASKMCAWLKMT
jgi:hypothetical protein